MVKNKVSRFYGSLCRTKAQLLLRWRHSVAQVEFAQSSEGEYLFLSNLSEYRHISTVVDPLAYTFVSSSFKH